jgi:hypothetical protein
MDEVNSTANFQVRETEKANLDSILNGTTTEMEMSVDEEEFLVPKAADGYCIECSDQPAIVFCEQCMDGI